MLAPSVPNECKFSFLLWKLEERSSGRNMLGILLISCSFTIPFKEFKIFIVPIMRNETSKISSFWIWMCICGFILGWTWTHDTPSGTGASFHHSRSLDSAYPLRSVELCIPPKPSIKAHFILFWFNIPNEALLWNVW